MSAFAASAAAIPTLIGQYPEADGWAFLPLSEREIRRAEVWSGRIIDSLGIGKGRHVLAICTLSDAAQMLPVELALAERHITFLTADASPYEFRRIESAMRRFDVAVVMRLTAAVLQGLRSAQLDPEQIFRGCVVYADLTAHAELQGTRAFTLLRWLQAGPALALECAHGCGAHVDGLEWRLESLDGEIVVGSRLDRCEAFAAVRTGLRASVDHRVCDCGSTDPRLVL